MVNVRIQQNWGKMVIPVGFTFKYIKQQSQAHEICSLSCWIIKKDSQAYVEKAVNPILLAFLLKVDIFNDTYLGNQMIL